MSPGEYWDGELYQHGLSLQAIMSLAKRQQPETLTLKYHVFDKIDDAPFLQRFKTINPFGCENVVVVHTTPLLDLDLQFRMARDKGYEGLILRDDFASYEPGKRSNGLIKVKEFADAEFTIVDITTGAQGEPVLVCRAGNNKTFRVTAPGTHAQRRKVLEDPDHYIGRLATIQHAGLTPYGIPFHPVCKIIL
jgi:hypothetical protein